MITLTRYEPVDEPVKRLKVDAKRRGIEKKICVLEEGVTKFASEDESLVGVRLTGESHQPGIAVSGSLDAHPLLSNLSRGVALNVEHSDPFIFSDADARLALTTLIYVSHTWLARNAEFNRDLANVVRWEFNSDRNRTTTARQQCCESDDAAIASS